GRERSHAAAIRNAGGRLPPGVERRHLVATRIGHHAGSTWSSSPANRRARLLLRDLAAGLGDRRRAPSATSPVRSSAMNGTRAGRACRPSLDVVVVNWNTGDYL